MPKVQFNATLPAVRVTQELLDLAKEQAVRERRDLSEIVRLAVEDRINKYRAEVLHEDPIPFGTPPEDRKKPKK